MRKSMIVGSSMLTVGALLLCALPSSAQENNTYINHATRFAVSPPLRDLAKLPQNTALWLPRSEPGSPHSETPDRISSRSG